MSEIINIDSHDCVDEKKHQEHSLGKFEESKQLITDIPQPELPQESVNNSEYLSYWVDELVKLNNSIQYGDSKQAINDFKKCKVQYSTIFTLMNENITQYSSIYEKLCGNFIQICSSQMTSKDLLPIVAFLAERIKKIENQQKRNIEIILLSKIDHLQILIDSSMLIEASRVSEEIQTILVSEQKNEINERYVAQALSVTGILLYHQGKFDEAEQLCQQVLAIRQRLHGDEHADTAASLNNLGSVYHSEGKYESAEELHKQALKIQQKLFGNDHIDIATSLNNLANAVLNQGKNNEAEEIFKEALFMRQRLYDEEHVNISISLHNLACVYFSQDKYTEAEQLLQQSLSIRQKLFGDEHADIAITLDNLASVYYRQAKYAEAEQLFKQVLMIQQKILGHRHIDVAMTLNNLASVFYNQANYIQAEQLLKEALSIREQILGNEHPFTRQTAQDLIICQSRL